MAFMFVEITFIHKFILFLGHPLYSISIIIFALLFSSGMGSLSSQYILGQNIKKSLKLALLVCCGVILLYLFLIPLFYQAFMSARLVLKMGLVFVSIFPLGFLMGFPFPTGIRLLKSKGGELIPWAWAINAFSSVTNSIAALLIAFVGGYNLVLIFAAGGYLFSLLFLDFAHHRNKTNS
jgi:hypothetical protein